MLTRDFTRGRIAQVFLVVAALAIAGLTWTSGPAAESVRGYEVGIGVVALIVITATIGLVEQGVQAAWMGAGFVAASLGRELVQARNASSIDAGIGLWLATACALMAALMLVSDMFLSIHENQTP